MTAPDLALADTAPGSYVLVVALLREERARAATPGPWLQAPDTHAGRVWIQRTAAKWHSLGPPDMEPLFSLRGDESYAQREADAAFVVAEANSAHALAEVALWRGVVERHRPYDDNIPALCYACHEAPEGCAGEWPCPDLLAVVAAAKAYLTGGAA